jgi:hypothetical protein
LSLCATANKLIFSKNSQPRSDRPAQIDSLAENRLVGRPFFSAFTGCGLPLPRFALRR